MRSADLMDVAGIIGHLTTMATGGNSVVRSAFRAAILITAGGVLASAAPPVIGVATAKGSFRIDQSPVWGNATVFDGTVVETGMAGSVIQLESGVQIRLGAATRGKVFRNHLRLEEGEGLVEHGVPYGIEAGNLRIAPSSAGASTRVAVEMGTRVQVAALRGKVEVSTAGGALLAKLEPGRPLQFQPQAAGAAPPVTLSGCVANQGGRYLLTDDTTGVTLELKGRDLEPYLGQRVEVAGADVAGASGVVRVTSIKRLPGDCVTAPGKSDNSTASAGRSSGGGTARLSSPAKAVIAGVAIAAVTTGATAALIGREEKRPAISR